MEDWWFDLIGPGFFIVPNEEVKLTYLMGEGWDRWHWQENLRNMKNTRHPDGVWLADLFPNGIGVKGLSRQKAKEILLSQPEDGGRSLFFASFCCGADLDEGRKLLLRSLTMGYTRSYCQLAQSGYTDENFLLAGMNAGSGYCCLLLARKCSRGDYLERGARLGDYECMFSHGVSYLKDDRRRWILTCYYTKNHHYGWDDWFTQTLHVKDVSTLFYIGEMTSKMQITLFELFAESPLASGYKRVMSDYTRVLNAVRSECVWWVLIAKRMGVNKDARKIVTKKIWMSRYEGREYE